MVYQNQLDSWPVCLMSVTAAAWSVGDVKKRLQYIRNFVPTVQIYFDEEK